MYPNITHNNVIEKSDQNLKKGHDFLALLQIIIRIHGVANV